MRVKQNDMSLAREIMPHEHVIDAEIVSINCDHDFKETESRVVDHRDMEYRVNTKCIHCGSTISYRY